MDMIAEPERKYRLDYRPPAYLIEHVDLDFDIGEHETRVTATYQARRDVNVDNADEAWWLDGREMTLESIAVDGQPMSEDDYEQSPMGLSIRNLPAKFELSIVNTIRPDDNTALEGLYRSDSILCTQCEATGFSRIMFFPDRPDVMARYTTRITADRDRYPILLANGNCVSESDVGGGRHTALFEDPFAKPCYLFAMIAGDLGSVTDTYATGSGRDIDLALYTEHGNEDQCHHAMASLKHAMAWDEATYGLEYDLDRFVIVAVGSFNMGAMENKGLNVFNTACIFARADTATDADFARVRDVVAHEYFHNYTGNRVTCRDWFQLSLKEGLTVYREHEFAIDQGSPGVTRIEQVRLMRELQFPEDAGPRAHPVRPDSYLQMNNFYTITVYEKGAEVIRMMAQIAGAHAFNQAVRFYLDKHDGRAVTIEDFVVAIEEATGLDLDQFRLWYAYAGTPTVAIKPSFTGGQLTLAVTQHTPATPDQPDKPDFDIPIALAFFDEDGRRLGEPKLERLCVGRDEWAFEGFDAEPTVSALRGMTAPVRLDMARSDADLARLMAHDDDPVSRWDAAQSLFLNYLLADVKARRAGNDSAPLPPALKTAIELQLNDPPADRALLAEILTLPSEARIGDALETIDPLAVTAARSGLKGLIARCFADSFARLAESHRPTGGYRFAVEDAGRRRVFALALDYLVCADAASGAERALATFDAADNMTDRMAALNTLRDERGSARERAMADFAARFADYPLVMDKWRALEAATDRDDSVEAVRALLDDPQLDSTNPNRVRAILGAFARRNSNGFHRTDGGGYGLIADEVIRLDRVNPQIAAALTGFLAPWRRYCEPFASAMRSELERIGTHATSDNVIEIVQAGTHD